MAKGRGVVLEIQNHQAVVLDETGLFRHVPAEGHDWQVGDEIWIDVGALALAPAGRGGVPRAGRPWWRSRGWAVAAACVVLIGVGLPLAYEANVSAQTVAVVTVDVNPSVELDLNASAHVLRAVGLDAAGQRLLAHLHVDGASLATAVTEVTDQAAADGFVSKTGTVPIVIAAAPTGGGKALPAAVATALKAGEQRSEASMTKAGYHVQVAAVSAPSSDQQSAKALHLSLGRYLIYQEAKSAGLAVKPSDLRGGAIVDALRRAGASTAAVQKVLQNLAKLDLTGSTTAQDRGTAAGTEAQTQGNGQGAATTVEGGPQKGQGPGSGQRATQGQGQKTGRDRGNSGDRGSGQGPGAGTAATSPPGGDQSQGAGPGGRNPGANQGARRGPGFSLATATASPSPRVAGQGGDGPGGTGTGARPGQAQAPGGWPERLWQDLQGLLHGNRRRQQGGRRTSGAAQGTGMATPSASAADRQRGTGPVQGASQSACATAAATATAGTGGGTDHGRQGGQAANGGVAGGGSGGQGGSHGAYGGSYGGQGGTQGTNGGAYGGQGGTQGTNGGAYGGSGGSQGASGGTNGGVQAGSGANGGGAGNACPPGQAQRYGQSQTQSQSGGRGHGH